MIKKSKGYIKLNYIVYIIIMVLSLFYSIIVGIVLKYPKVVNILFTSCILDLGLNKIWNYYIKIKEKLLIYSYQNKEIEFNKEYYDIYWDYNLIISKIFIYCMYLSFAFVPKLLWDIFHIEKIFHVENHPCNLMKICITAIVILLSINIFVFITVLFFQSFTDIKIVNQLIEKKGQNYDSYNEAEKKIIVQCIREREDRK